ncbi:MAG: glycosyltransferase [Clostridia bacterium]|nr:glycosyltransferase [Clostridia bacterium]
MKVCFIGSLISDKTLDKIVAGSRVKPSNAPVNFENMLVKGLEEAGVDTTVLSLPAVSTYPGGTMLAWGRRKETLNFGKEVRWIPCLNLMGAKQLTAKISVYAQLFRWLVCNRKEKDKILMNYSVYPPYSKPTQIMGRLFGVKTCCIVSDLPEYLYKMHETKGIKSMLNNRMSRNMVRLQGRFDSYICLTEYMPRRMNIEDKPWLLMEGFADPGIFDGLEATEKTDKKTVMYAGALSKSFNIDKLLDGFMQTEGDYRLWLFGYGDLIDYIHECEQKDDRITYFGKVDRNVLLEHEKAAHLLISVKSAEEDHANYAFPSKILEYMTSGTAVASTRVGGIPKEYFDYIYSIEGETAEAIGTAIQTVLKKESTELKAKGEKSCAYAVKHKNYEFQGKRLADFLKSQI